MRLGVILAGFLGFAFVATDTLAQDLEAGKQHYVFCSACHGEQGEGVQELNAPRFGELSDWYLMRQALNYREGIRGTHPDDELGAQMRTMLLALPDDDAVLDVVAYITSLESPPPEPTVEADVERGRELFNTCVACHGPSGEGNQALNAPRLAGQSDWYLVRQLKSFQKGWRGTAPEDPAGASMRPMAMLLADEAAIHDVVAYINTLQPAQ